MKGSFGGVDNVISFGLSWFNICSNRHWYVWTSLPCSPQKLSKVLCNEGFEETRGGALKTSRAYQLRKADPGFCQVSIYSEPVSKQTP